MLLDTPGCCWINCRGIWQANVPVPPPKSLEPDRATFSTIVEFMKELPWCKASCRAKHRGHMMCCGRGAVVLGVVHCLLEEGVPGVGLFLKGVNALC